MEKKKIAFYHNLTSGGACRAAYEIIYRLRESYNIDLYSVNNTKTILSKEVKKLNKLFFKQYIYKITVPENFINLQFFLLRKYKRIHQKIALDIDRKKYKLIFLTHDFLTKSPYLLRYLKTKSLYLCQEEPRELYRSNIFSTKLKHKIVNLLRSYLKREDLINVKSANYLFTNSNFSKKKLEKIYSKRFTVLQHGVNLKKFKKIRDSKKQKFFLSVGAFAKFKGYDFLIKSISLLPKQYKYPLIVIGDKGRDYIKLKKLAKEKKVRTIIRSHINDNKLIEFYNNTSLFLFAGIKEPLGLCILEALACGAKVLAINEGGISEILKNFNNNFLSIRNEKKFSHLIIYNINNTSYNYEKTKKYLLKKWNWQTSINQIRSLININYPNKMKKIGIVRGSYLNKYEMQNYEPLANKFDITGFSGLKPIHHNFKFPIKKLFSPVDLPNFAYKMPILNRLCLGDAMFLFGLENKLKGFDIVHTRETYFHFTQQALNAKKKGYLKKVICTCSETIPFNNEGIWNRKKFKKRAIKEVDIFHCLTKKAKQCLIKEGCNPKKIVVFPYGVDLKKFRPRSSAINHQASAINLLFVARLVKEKGIYDLLKAYVQLIKQKVKVNLTIIGEGQEKENIINLVDQIKLKKSIKLKQVAYQKMPEEYQKADIFVLLSKPTKYWEEYLGMSLIEAMASGLAIVSTKCGAIPEVINNCGLLVPSGDWKSAYKALLKLIKDKKLRKKLSFQARKRAEKYFDSQKTAKNIEKLWEK